MARRVRSTAPPADDLVSRYELARRLRRLELKLMAAPPPVQTEARAAIAASFRQTGLAGAVAALEAFLQDAGLGIEPTIAAVSNSVAAMVQRGFAPEQMERYVCAREATLARKRVP